jgi:broad specificity phosphatase PhoE
LAVESDLTEQSLGDWHGLPHAELPPRLTRPKHAFWPLAGNEKPPNGESMAEVITRVGAAMERLAETHAGRDVVIVSHGGAIRGAIAHALRIGADNALHLSIQNLSLSRLERSPDGWRVLCVNELPGY